MPVCNVCSSDPAKVCGGCGQIAYCGRECQTVDRKKHRENCYPVKVEQMRAMGRGVVATRNIMQGQVLMIDTAFLVISRDLCDPEKWSTLGEMVSRLPTVVRDQFYTLQPRLGLEEEFDEDKELLTAKIFLNNAIALGATGTETRLGIFPRLSMFNHSCMPNAKWSKTKSRLERKEVRALTDIAIGDEVTCSYFGDDEEMAFASRLIRQQFLSSWNFVCSCQVCRLEGENLEENESKRMDLRRISSNIDMEGDQVRKARFCLQKLDKMKMMGVEVLSELSYTYQHAFMSCWSTDEDDWMMKAELVRLDWRRWVESFPLHSVRLQYISVVEE